MAIYYTAWELGIGGGQVLLGLLFSVGGFVGLFGTAAAIALIGAVLAAVPFGPPPGSRTGRSGAVAGG
jgi:hypothetical protein